MGLVEIAKEIATKAHEGQVRKMGDDKGKPYIIHPERVAANFHDERLQAIAWLHDVLEDNPMYSPETLYAAGIPLEVVDAVRLLTHRPDVTYFNYIMALSDDRNWMAREVKIADITDNLQSCPKGSMKDKYELAKYILEVADAP